MKNGFTLIELMIIVATAGILIAMVLPSYNESRYVKAQYNSIQYFEIESKPDTKE